MTDNPGFRLQVRSSFARSANLEYDAATWLEQSPPYVLTPLVRELLGRVADAVTSDRRSRAWSITGPYGTGKSAFALAVLQLLGPGPQEVPLIRTLGTEDQALSDRFAGIRASGLRLLPVLLTGRRQGIGLALKQALLHSVGAYSDDFPEIRKLDRAVTSADFHNAQEVASVLDDCARAAGGLLVIIDELGQFLEYATQHPDSNDIFILQQLGEIASRSSSQPILAMTILHQAFSLYGAHSSKEQREELAKIQGRYEDVSFQQPSDQMLRLIAKAIDFDPGLSLSAVYASEMRDLADRAVDLGVAPSAMSLGEVRQLLIDCAPIHPMTALVLARLFKKLAQNERSVFAFLSSGEPHGLHDVMARQAETGPILYTIDHLYDYVTTSCGSWLHLDPIDGRRWAQVEMALSRLRRVDPLDVRLIKAIGLMNVLGEIGEMRASAALLSYALMVPIEAVTTSLQGLKDRSAVVYRAFSDSYRLWDGSDIDIESRLSTARAKINHSESLAQLLMRRIPQRPLVARRHSYRTGSLRFFNVGYASPSDIGNSVTKLREAPGNADGTVLYVPCESESEHQRVARTMTQMGMQLPSNTVVIALSVPRAVREWALEREALAWVDSNTPELREDRVAHHELRSRVAIAEEALDEHIRAALGSAGRLQAFHRGHMHSLPSPRALNALLSDICDEIYSATPVLRNELINRDSLSSSAAAARRNLLEAMIEKRDRDRLGIQMYPPELSMYKSLLESTRVHRCQDGRWGFFRPEGGAVDVSPVWDVMEGFLDSTLDGRRSVCELWSMLRKPPLGLKYGVIPVFTLALLLERESEVAVYEQGSFTPELTIAHVERMLRSPDKFEIRYAPLNSAREEVFSEMAARGFAGADTRQALSVLRPILVSVSRLPAFSQKTKTVGLEAQRVRNAIVAAREPDQLLFEQLPVALGLQAFRATEASDDVARAAQYAENLRLALDELRTAYDKLLDRLARAIAATFGTSQDISVARHQLRDRLQGIATPLLDLHMKALVNRLADPVPDDRAWVESVATHLVSKPPQSWGDAEMDLFQGELSQCAFRLRGLEDMSFFIGREPSERSTPARIGITLAGGGDYHHVVFLGDDQRPAVSEVAATIMADMRMLDNEEKIAAVAEVLKSILVRE